MCFIQFIVHLSATWVVLFSSAISAQALYTQPCPILNLNFPALSSYAFNDVVRSATETLNRNITQALNQSTVYGQVDSVSTAFSIDVYSLHDEQSLLNYQYTPNALVAQHSVGVTTVDSNTIYRVGSISKLMTVYIYLITAGDSTWNDPVTKYVPELAAYVANNQELFRDDQIDIVDWNSITMGALASQLSGIAREEAYSPAFEQAQQQSLGLPPVSRNESDSCGDGSVIEIPSFFNDFLKQHPITAPFTTAIYSNIAYQILGYALQNLTGKAMTDLFSEALVQGLNLNSTYYTVPPSANTSIVPGNTSTSLWDFDARDESPVGGHFSSVNDLRKIGKSILNSTLLSPAQTRRWLKPHAFTADVNFAVGAPWEILRAPGDTVSWIYSKTGDVGAYSGIVAFLTDYNVGITVLGAGASASDTVRVLSDLVVNGIVPSLYTATQAAAVAAYAGTYSNATTNSTVTISAPESGPGLVIANWTLNGTQAIPILGSLLGVNETTQTLQLNLYPTGLARNNGTTLSWRVIFRVLPQALDPGVFSTNCVSWGTANTVAYSDVGLDEFLFTLDGDGSAISIEPRVFGWDLMRANGSMTARSFQRLS